jgi:hypothetical protein
MRFLFPLLLGLSFLRSAVADDQQASVESKLRDALRSTMMQERDQQNQIVTLQATQAQSDKDNADLKAKVDLLTSQLAAAVKQSASDKATADAAIASQKAQIADLNSELQKYSDAVAAWKKDDAEKTALAASKEAARAQLAGDVIALQRLVADRETKNMVLYQTGNEILTRYENFGLGDALAAKEPFVGLTRVKLQEQVQDYRDKLLDHVVTTPGTLGPSAPAAARPPGPAGKPAASAPMATASTTRP